MAWSRQQEDLLPGNTALLKAKHSNSALPASWLAAHPLGSPHQMLTPFKGKLLQPSVRLTPQPPPSTKSSPSPPAKTVSTSSTPKHFSVFYMVFDSTFKNIFKVLKL